MNEFPDYKKSMFKHSATKVTLIGPKKDRATIEREQEKAKAIYEANKEKRGGD